MDSFGREQGDGMEKVEEEDVSVVKEEEIRPEPEVLPLPKVNIIGSCHPLLLQLSGILLPDTTLVFSKLPPIHDIVSLRPSPRRPSQRLVAEKAKVYPKGTLPPAVKKQREPKFVPYEPYR